ncbi:MAG: phage tail tape measure protein, partial [Hyphomicrobium sp.]
MAGNMTVSVLLRLVDGLSGPAKNATAGLRGIAAGAKGVAPAANAGAAASERLARGFQHVASTGAAAASSANASASATGRAAAAADRAASSFTRMGSAAQRGFALIKPPAHLATVENYAKAHERIQAQMGRASSGTLMGGLTIGAAGYPIKRAADHELNLTRFGNVAGYNEGDNRPGAKGDTFGARIGEIDKKFRLEARETRQYASDILLGVDNLVARGMDQKEALGLSKLIGKAATATGTDNNDLANMAYALRNNLGISEAMMPKAFDVAHSAGKQGGFELKNMAKWYPELTTSFAAYGLKGDQVGMRSLASISAMLQVAREGSATPDKAANNVANILQKLMIKETGKNFEKAMGVDFAKEMQGAVKRGENPIEHLIGLVVKFMDKNDDNMFKLGELFGDRQAADGLRPLYTNRARVAEITEKALAANGDIDRDFDRVVRTFSMRAKGLAIAADNLANTLTQGPMGEGKGMLGWLEDGLTTLDGWAQKSPGTTAGIMNVGLGLLGFAVASKAFAWVAGGVKLGALGLAGAFYKLNGAGANVSKVARVMRWIGLGWGAGSGLAIGASAGAAAGAAGVARMTRLAYRFAGAWGAAKYLMRGAMRLGGVGLAISGAMLLYSHWDRLKALFAEPLKIDIIFPELPEWMKRLWKAPFEESAETARRNGWDKADADKPTIGAWAGQKWDGVKRWWSDEKPAPPIAQKPV